MSASSNDGAAMSWTRIEPWYWIAGIYKIVSYRDGEFLAYYMPDHYKHWGDYVSQPPDNGRYSKCWSSFESAEAACVEHAKRHTPKPRTVKRAAEVMVALVEKGIAA